MTNSLKQFFKIVKWIKNAKLRIISQKIILSLKRRNKITNTIYDKVKIMFKTHFLSSSSILTNEIEKFFSLLSANDKKTMINRKLIKVVYKINLNKTSKINKTIYKTLKYFVAVVTKKICFFFDKCIKKNIWLTHFKIVFTIIIWKLDNKNYAKLLLHNIKLI